MLWFLVTTNVSSSWPILVTDDGGDTLVLTRATQHNIAEDGIIHHNKKLKVPLLRITNSITLSILYESKVISRIN
jgi:hypothetical protein